MDDVEGASIHGDTEGRGMVTPDADEEEFSGMVEGEVTINKSKE
jgi:hypothetical protein